MMTTDTAIGMAIDTDLRHCQILQQQQDRDIPTNINHVMETQDMIQEGATMITITLAPPTPNSNKHTLVDITQTIDSIMMIDDINDTTMTTTNPDLARLDVLWRGKKQWSSKDRKVLSVFCI
jgi:hypothetical protein